MITLHALIAISFLVNAGQTYEVVSTGHVLEIQADRINIGGDWFEYAVGSETDVQQVFEGLPPVDQIRVPFRAEIVFVFEEGQPLAKVAKVRPAPRPEDNTSLISGGNDNPNY